MPKFKVAYATGSRADYGIVRRYLKKLDNDKNIDFSVLVTGSHLEKQFGNSVDNILADGFTIDYQAKLNIDNSSNAGVMHSMAIALDLFGTYFENNKYDLLIILGDRYEMMAVAVAAAMQKIPILHLHGGEVTYGNYDEFIRHCISKMSLYHFTSTPTYRDRVIQLGEAPQRVYYMGALGAENCQYIDETLVPDWIKRLPNKGYFVVAFHPETLTDVSLLDQIHEILKALSLYDNNYQFVLMGSNADTNSGIIQQTWKAYAESHENVTYIENLNVDAYLFMVKNAIALVGNSSSGIIEAPSLGSMTINIGDRQAGRVAGESVQNVRCEASKISEAMNTAIKSIGISFENPYYLPNTADNYYKKTLEILSNPATVPKSFYDIKN